MIKTRLSTSFVSLIQYFKKLNKFSEENVFRILKQNSFLSLDGFWR